MKRLIVHIGQHKTGSKALQSFAFLNRHRLAQSGLLYPQGHPPDEPQWAYRVSHFRLYQALLRQDQEGLQGWLRELATQPQHTVWLSAEDVFEMLPAHDLNFCLARAQQAASTLRRAAQNCGFRAEVVVYLRRQDQSLVSHYSQYLRNGGNPGLSFDSFWQSTMWRLDPRPTLQAWASRFPDGCFHLREYAPGRVVQDFFTALLDPALLQHCRWPKPTLETVNPSSDRDTLELIRLSHRLGLRGMLYALVASAPPKAPPANIRSWLDPMQLRTLQELCRSINGDIARTYLAQNQLSWPALESADGDHWEVYPGLRLTTALRRLVSAFLYRLKPWRSSLQRGAQAWVE